MAINNDLLGAKYQKPRNWITERLQDGTPWEELVSHPTSLPTAQFLNFKVQVDKWPVISSEEWEVLVRQQNEAEEKAVSLNIKRGQALVIDGTSNNGVTLPDNEHTCWQLYKSKLEKDGFASQAIEEIERATLKILRRLSEDTRALGPIKGLVIGNVQSGKTANMAALMAMAADWGWNMFIILSGTIENLRIQTQDRLWNDLNNAGCNLYWNSLEHLSPRSPLGSRAQDLRFEPDARQRYFSVTLKNATRLKSLIRWLQKDKNKMQQMKILVIDDEADQAGINTAPVSNAERKKINKLICSLANGWDAEGRKISDRYMAMNYIGYTATPYANILNESSLESLYPRNFIATLSVSDQYFGPQQVFGCPETEFRGLDIIRNVSDGDLSEIKDIHKGTSVNLPDSIKDALCWFMCSVAAIRKTGSKKPISMLVHTSQRVQHHTNVSKLIRDWVNHEDRNALLERCKRVWSAETGRFSREEFLEQYPGYGLADKVNDYPSFDSIEAEIRDILSIELKPIKLNEEGEMKYHKGIHLCVDNSANNGRNDENEYLRLVYPKKDVTLDKAPAFLVIGGATLSRGLTLEGLVCTFFLRSVKQADTLMQMGRWFGYRKGYELYPRLWITDTTRLQFEYLSILDQELREDPAGGKLSAGLPEGLQQLRHEEAAHEHQVAGIHIDIADRSLEFHVGGIAPAGGIEPEYVDSGPLHHHHGGEYQHAGRGGENHRPQAHAGNGKHQEQGKVTQLCEQALPAHGHPDPPAVRPQWAEDAGKHHPQDEERGNGQHGYPGTGKTAGRLLRAGNTAGTRDQGEGGQHQHDGPFVSGNLGICAELEKREKARPQARGHGHHCVNPLETTVFS